ncbi:putative mitochondrial import receptor subunit TOM5 -like protein [Capsicum annuum]|uniref:Uncharacterized protein n=1 Tax=Capsicum annuum TaxID=4072 RepID=A0A1U8G5N3_CAPAN|nr:uncharacterized protein LOC107862309 [Capsicum annuum]KAF3615327.1 putative mitochondrial import receptor subunit TOM5 -like protein [Capsicum annuum]KAF3621063.1 putative mitochondrial import receptor subunit TOM5 -like protein [Capsicum annuum]PHT88329.1 hypothetical protein T459_10435 [Capsicum annuum]
MIMEAIGIARFSASNTPLLIRSMATQKPTPSTNKTVTSKKPTTVFPLGEKGPRPSNSSSAPPVKLLTRVEQLRLLTKAEKAGLLSAAEKSGLSLSTIERLGLLSKAEESGILSAATDPSTPSALFSLSLALLVVGPACVYLVPEDYPWQIALQVVVALLSVVGGSAAFGASNLVSTLQRS